MRAAYGGVVSAAGSCETDSVVDVSIPVEAAPQEQVDEVVETQRPWITIVWNDPINLMSYVTYVFMTYFHFSRDKAEKLMNDVHHEGRAVVSSGTREEMERDVGAMHSYGLWATLQRDD
ncbi:MAG: ATP-dependent Clp protease adapter ClpS [Actinomycetales bacterium]|nr:ATP-dependent Clp protease adapter ClpS [Actinomycetales bacterium]MCP4893637.1 ATP-dependent Clp protease adapter ClpS [Actinomycetales bacterium]